MTSPLESVYAQIVVDLEALVPETRPTIRYTCVTGREAKRGSTSDRRFVLGLASPSYVSSAGDTSYIEWNFEVAVRLDMAGSTLLAFSQRCASELQAIQATLVNRTSWPSNVQDFQVVTSNVEYEEEANRAILKLNCSSLCAETASYTYADPLSAPSSSGSSSSSSGTPFSVSVALSPTSAWGTDETEVGTVSLSAGFAGSWTVVSHLDTTEVTSASSGRVTVRLRDIDGNELAAIDTESTTPVEQSEHIEIVDDGTYIITITTSALNGVGAIASSDFSGEIYE